jgi:hypothetical protein
VDLRINHHVLPHIIKLPTHQLGTILPPRYFADLESTTPLPSDQGIPTLKIMLATKSHIKTREYLPIRILRLDDTPPGLTWIPIKSLSPPQLDLYILSITNSEYTECHLPFQWDTTIHPEQLNLSKHLQLYRAPRIRTWKQSIGKSVLRSSEPIQEHSFQHPQEQPIHTTKQVFTWTIPLWTIQDDPTFCILMNGLETTKNHPFGNLYLRIFNKHNTYYVLHCRPSNGGITIIIHPHYLYFSRISGYQLRFIYKHLSRVKNWVAISEHYPEYRLIGSPISHELHSRLSSVMSSTH